MFDDQIISLRNCISPGTSLVVVCSFRAATPDVSQLAKANVPIVPCRAPQQNLSAYDKQSQTASMHFLHTPALPTVS
jgi:hypothetical protein